MYFRKLQLNQNHKIRVIGGYFPNVLSFPAVSPFIKWLLVSFKAEECALRSNVDRFNTRRYANLLGGVGGGAGGGSITENCGSAVPSDSALTVINYEPFYLEHCS